MSNVTKEEFKQAMKHVDERFDAIDKRFHAVDKHFDAIDERFTVIEDRFDAMAAMIARGFEDIARRLDVRERVDALEQKMKKVESALNVRL